MMLFPSRTNRFVVSIVILVIASRPFVSVGFLPPNTCNWQHQQGRFSSTLSRHVDLEQRIGYQRRYNDATVTVTSLHAFPEIIGGGAVLVAGFASWLYIDGASGRDRQRMRAEEAERVNAIQAERARLAYIEPQEYWTEAELAPYDGSRDEDGPILIAADGSVFNVYKGRNFYLPGCEYHIFAGRDATRLLARNKLEEETEEELKRPLNIGERAYLATWIYTFKGKYDIVGKLEGFDPKTTAM